MVVSPRYAQRLSHGYALTYFPLSACHSSPSRHFTRARWKNG